MEARCGRTVHALGPSVRMSKPSGPENRIVVAYDEPRLTLLAVREMTTGRYLSHGALTELGIHYGIPVVDTVGSIENIKNATLEDLQKLPGITAEIAEKISRAVETTSTS